MSFQSRESSAAAAASDHRAPGFPRQPFFSCFAPASLLEPAICFLRLESSSPTPCIRFGGEDDVVLVRRRHVRLEAIVVLLEIGSSLWLWHRAQPTVRPRTAEPMMSVRSVSTSLRLRAISGFPAFRRTGPSRWKIDAIWHSGSFGAISSPAICSVRNCRTACRGSGVDDVVTVPPRVGYVRSYS